jgi:diguanylate cyclase
MRADETRVARAKDTFALLDSAMSMHEANNRRFTIKSETIRLKVAARTNRATDVLAQRIATLENQLEQANDTIKRLERDTSIDSLTGVLNRGGLDKALRTEWNRCANSRQQLGVIFVDMDNFKSINDTFDHSIGDAALTAVGTQLMRCLRRAGEVVGRYGGDEFIAVVPQTSARDTAALAEIMRKSIDAIELPVGDKRIKLSTSIGAAFTVENDNRGTLAQLVENADAALKGAKESGKNAAVLFDGGTLLAIQSATGPAQPKTVAVRGSR